MALAAHTKKWKILELFFVAHVALGLFLESIFQLKQLLRNYVVPSIVVGAIVSLIAVILVSLARRDFREHFQPTDPGASTTKLIVTGVFSFTRNPLTISTILLLVGLGLILQNLWFLLLVIPNTWTIYFILIKPEEKYLSTIFGKSYAMYCKKVPRWLLF